MPLKISSLSHACESVRLFLHNSIDDAPTDVTVQIGSPGEIDENNTQNIVNLFFYRFEPSGFGPLSTPNQPWRLRVYCLITVFGGMLDSVGAGENELRMLGEVMRLFHENPILDLQQFDPEGNGETIGFRLKSVFQPMSEDQLSQFWTANSATAIRPSVAYEFSLVSIVPESAYVEPPLVGAIAAETRGDLQQNKFAASNVVPTSPQLKRYDIQIENPSWEPGICWIFNSQCELALVISRTDAAAFTPEVWVAGAPSETVQLVWQIWNSATGWEQDTGSPVDANPFSQGIDPDNIPASIPATFPLQVPLPSIGSSGASQVMLHARRTFTIVAGGPSRTVLSNPILISIFDPS